MADDELSGEEWFYGLIALGQQLDSILLVDDVDLYSTSDLETSHERLGINNLRISISRAIHELIGQLSQLNLDERSGTTLVYHITSLAQLAINAGPYQPWIERLRSLRRIGEEKQSRKAISRLGTEAILKKTVPLTELIEKHYRDAPLKPNGKLLHAGKLLVAVNAELGNGRSISGKTLRRHLERIRKGQTPDMSI